jgi:pimeloyl-ACP methyl ester carboxylesterase
MVSITLVLLPGMHGTGRLFAPFLRELPDSIKPVVVSYPPDRTLDYQGHLDIVMATLPENVPFVLLGESFSGPLALMAAARRPKGLCGVILCATFATWPLPLAPSLARLIVALGVFRLKSTRLFLRLLHGGNISDEIKHLFSEALAQMKQGVLDARARTVTEMDCSEELRQCHVPLLSMVSDHDRIITLRCMELMQSIRPDMEIVHFSSPHIILQCAPVEAMAEIARFCESVSTVENQQDLHK